MYRKTVDLEIMQSNNLISIPRNSHFWLSITTDLNWLQLLGRNNDICVGMGVRKLSLYSIIWSKNSPKDCTHYKYDICIGKSDGPTNNNLIDLCLNIWLKKN